MKKLCFAIIGLSLLLTSCTNLRKYTSYVSQDSLFTINVPESYAFLQQNNNLMAWQDNENVISIRKDYIIKKAEFINFVDRTARNLPSKFTVDLENDSNDSIRHYTVHTATFYRQDIFFLKEGSASMYIIEVSGESFETAKKIASSFKELNKPTVQQTKDKTIFKKEGFAIDKSYNLVIYTEYVNQINKLDGPDKPNLIGAYYCLQDKESPKTATVINVNVFDISNQPQKGRLDAYIDQLNSAGIKNNRTTFQGFDGVAYSYEQNMGDDDVPSKALYVIRDNKYYLIQVTAQNGVESKFDKLLESITFIK